jgi:indole-3-glycerol phosphate synthase
MSVLDRILAAKREEVERLRPREADLRNLAAGLLPAKPFANALRAGTNVALIAEFKRRSPSANWIRQDGSVAKITKDYSEAGARAISVLTDEQFFSGTLQDLRIARDKTFVPILRKDFVIDELQLVEARAAGADAVLLIVRALSDLQLPNLLQAATALGLEALVEAHDQAEVDRALAAGSEVVGINHRDLATFTVDHSITQRIAANVPKQVVLVAESGVRTRADVVRLAECGIDAVLVGETLMRASDTVACVHEFTTVPRVPRT